MRLMRPPRGAAGLWHRVPALERTPAMVRHKEKPGKCEAFHEFPDTGIEVLLQCMSNSTSANAPIAIRYQAKTPKPCRLMKRTKASTTTSAERKAATKPSAITPLPCQSSVQQF